MGLLRLITSSPFHHGLSKGESEEIQLHFHVPAYGILYLNRPRVIDHFDPETPPPFEQYDASGPSTNKGGPALRGELEVILTGRNGARSCKKIKLGMRTLVRMAMGPERGWEEDEIWQQSMEMGDGDEPIVFQPGTTKLEFVFPLPHSFPPHDWHPEVKIRHEVWAELTGVPKSSSHHYHSPSSFFRTSSRSASRHVSPHPSRPPSPGPSSRSRSSRTPQRSRPPSPTRPQSGDALSVQQLSHALNQLHLPDIPTYAESESATPSVQSPNESWLEGTYKARRGIRVVYNPNPEGNVNALDDRINGEAEIGHYTINLRAPIWVVNAIVWGSFRFIDIPTDITIFEIKYNIAQILTLHSPRAKAKEEPHVSRKWFNVAKHGRRPPHESKRPGVKHQALWRGRRAGGEDEGIYEAELKGRLPDDKDMRPSTLPGIETPVHVAHQMIVEIMFSTWNIDAHGKPMAKEGPGEPRVLKLVKDVTVPGCPNIPQVFSLPTYTHVATNRLQSTPHVPCPVCHVPPEDRLCTSCPFGVPSHPRHDHHPKLVGRSDGICPLCSKDYLHEGSHQNWVNCACAMSDAEFEAMVTSETPGAVMITSRREGEHASEEALEKETYEGRGRTRDRH